jgi:hypothetical protein
VIAAAAAGPVNRLRAFRVQRTTCGRTFNLRNIERDSQTIEQKAAQTDD